MSQFNGLKDFSKQFRDVLLKYTLPTPPDIVTGLATIVPNNYASYLNDIGFEASISERTNVNPGSVDDHMVYREADLNKNMPTPNDIIEGVNNLTQTETVIVNYIDSVDKPTILSDYAVSNSGSIDDHNQYREKILKQNQTLLPEIQVGLDELSQTQMTTKNYTDNLDQPALINDRQVINPGSVDDHSKYREENLVRNQQVQTDILAGLAELSESKSTVRNYLDNIDKPTIISDLVVTNPGNVQFFGDQQRTTDLSRNRKIDLTNASQGGSSDVGTSVTQLTYNNWIHDIGQDAKIGDYMVVGQTDLDSNTVQDPASGINVDKNLIEAFNLNLYTPSQGFQIFDETIIELKRNLKDSGQGFWTDDKLSFVAQQYQPADFLQGVGSFDIGSETLDLSQLINDTVMNNGFIADGILGLLGSNSILKGESMLMNLASISLRYNFTERIKSALVRETLLSSKIDEALTNPLVGLDIIRDPLSVIEKNYQISVSANPIGAAGDLASRIMGTISPTEYFGLGEFLRDNTYKETLTPKTLKRDAVTKKIGGLTALIDDVTGKSIKYKDHDAWLLNRTGAGQKAQLFQNISFNKYRPDFIPDYNTDIANGIFSVMNYINGITGFLGSSGKATTGNYYLGKNNVVDPVNIMQQSEGFYQEHTVEDLTATFGDAFDSANNELVRIGGYGIISSEFAWTDKSKSTINGMNIYLANTKFSYDYINTYKEGTLMDFTQKLVETKMPTIGSETNQRPTMIAQVINQLNTSFNDGYQTVSKGSAVKGYENVIDSTGRRDYNAMLNSNGDYCRVWTKERPYGKISTTMKYSELIRLERNSVMDRFGNLNIFPSKLNVNTGYGDPRFTTTDGRAAVTDHYGELRARKYMFSIENLAWRDTALERALPPCEKGPNGGRVMWFPPYDINVTDNNQANWTSTVFLGRPEPVYTYNSTERTGTLNFKIVVDHPTILNVLVRQELKNLSAEGVDAILDSFWAGCIKYDIFDLARMWGVFTIDELTALKGYLSQINGLDPHPVSGQKIYSDRVKGGEKDNTKPIEKPIDDGKQQFIESYVYFQNNVPEPTDKTGAADDLTKIKSYENYFNVYKSNLSNSKGVKNLSYKVGKYDKNTNKVTEVSGSKTFAERYDLGLKNYPEVIKTITNSLDGLKNSWSALLQGTRGKDISAPFTTYASPIATKDYNKKLGLRRFVSIAKFLIAQTGKVYDVNKTEITNPNNCFNSDFTKATFYRPGLKPNEYNKIELEIKFYGEVGAQNAEHKLFDPADKLLGVGGYLNTTKTPDYPFYPCDYTFENGKTVQIRILNTDNAQVDSTSDKILNEYYKKLVAAGENVIYPTEDLTSADGQDAGSKTTTIALASISGFVNGRHLRAPSIIGSITSPIACLSRFGHFFDTIIVEPTKETTVTTTPEKTPPGENKVPQPWEYYDPGKELNTNVAFSNITKRDIAQRILNKLVTECDYFDYLDKDYPGIFTNLKDKLKYFSPAFHAITPEGLNGRLTFLQQCLRPGQTIISQTSESCDANNTAFGKPPVCILRIGDFYHSKIIIDSINFDYEPMVYDLNPEGIGVQPMIANVNMSFKFIGGQGLRKAVDQLQNALSFNYFANTDVYDDRTFANTDEYERALINLETSFFDQDELDIARIVENAAKIKDLEIPAGGTVGTIGQPLVGNNIVSPISPVCQYIANDSYIPGDIVQYGLGDNGTPKTWLCILEINPDMVVEGETTPVEGSVYWELKGVVASTVDDNSADGYLPFLIPTKSLYPYQKEYGSTYMDFYKLNYWNTFNNLYNSLDRLFSRRINRYNDLSKIYTDSSVPEANLLLNNPIITAGILMNSYYGTNVPNPLYNTDTDRAVINMLSLPEELTYNNESVSAVTFQTIGGSIMPKTGVITANGGASGLTVTVKKGTDGLYHKYVKAETDGENVNSFYNKYLFADDEFYKMGIDTSQMTGGKTQEDIQLLMPHLYPQGGYYRMPNASIYIQNPESYSDYSTIASFAKLDFPGDTFRTRPFQEFFIPKPDNYSEGPRNNAIDLFGTAIGELILNLNLSAFRRDFKAEGNKMSNLLVNCDSAIKQSLIDQLTINADANMNLIKNAYNNYLYSSDSNFSNDNDAYYTAVQTFADLAMILNGVDAGVDENGQLTYYDVIPNAITYGGKTNMDGDIKRGEWEEKFKYNAYQELLVNDIQLVEVSEKPHKLKLGSKEANYKIKTLKNSIKPFNNATTNASGSKVYTLNSDSLTAYLEQTNEIFQNVSNKYTKYLFRTPMDYFIHQTTSFNYGMSNDTPNVNVGKTYNYGLPYVSLSGDTAGSVISVSTVIDYVGKGAYSDAIDINNPIPVSEAELKSLPNEYKTLSGQILKAPGANGMFYLHENNPAATDDHPYQDKPSITTVFERMNHEFIYLTQKFDQALMLDTSKQLMDLNTIHIVNKFEENAGYVEFKKFFTDNGHTEGFEKETYSSEFYQILNMRGNTSIPVSVTSPDSNAINGNEPKDFVIFRELSNLLYYDRYVTKEEILGIYKDFVDSSDLQYDFETVVEYNTSTKTTEPLKLSGIRTFEEIVFANVIYSGAGDIVSSLIMDVNTKIKELGSKNKQIFASKTAKDSNQQKIDVLNNTLEFLNITKSNIDQIIVKLKKVYEDTDKFYKGIVDESNKEYQKIKPTIINDKGAYNLKLKKAVSTSTVNKFLYKQRKPSRGDITLGSE